MSEPLDLLLGEEGDILQAVAEQSHDGIKLISLDGRVEYLSDNARARVALANRGEMIGSNWIDLWPTECHAKVRAAVREAAAGRMSRFEAYDADRWGTPRWWEVSVSPVRRPSGEITRLLATSRDVTAERAERQSNRDQRAEAEANADAHDIVAREMRHRLKNLLAMVTSIARLSGRQAERTVDFLPIFAGRISDLAAAQHLLTEDADQRADLPALIEAVLGGDSDRDQRIRVGSVAPVRLEERSTRVVALVLGELLTNARKYGALSGDGGSVELVTALDEDCIAFTWSEECEQPIDQAPKPGSGTVLMERMTAREPGPLAVEWRRQGIMARFAVRL